MDDFSNGNAADVVGGLSTLLSTVASVREGYDKAAAYKMAAKHATDQGDFEASQYLKKANQTRAEGQASAIEERRQGRLAKSRAEAVAGASGAGVNADVTVQDILSGLEGQGEYNALSRLYTSENEARGYEDLAKVSQFNAKSDAAGYKLAGKGYKLNGWEKGVGHLLEGGATFLENYGDDDNDTITPVGSYGSAHGGRKVNF